MAGCMVFTIFFAKGLLKTHSIKETTDFKGVLTLWHIDSFEGGKGSRAQFLLKTARTFEKQENGVLVMVITHTKESAENQMRQGDFPDMISYGLGVEVKNLKELGGICNLKYGNVGKKQYAVPWCRGGYYFIENLDFKGDTSNVVVSEAEYTQPCIAMRLAGITGDDILVMSPMDAYVTFVADKTRYLVGTQRDVVRLSNRGKICKITPIKEFSDLYQYISVLTADSEKYKLSIDFISLLLGKSEQTRLNQISMFSVVHSVIHDNEFLLDGQKTVIQNTLSPFISSVQLKSLQQDGLMWVKGDNSYEEKIKKILI